MAENTKIEWAHHTFNPWIGCTKVSPACDHCYAEKERASTALGVTWGPNMPRHRTSEANWKKPGRWNAEAERLGVRYRVFCASLADVFDNEVPVQWRRDLFDLIEKTPHLDWLLLTKRIGNAEKMIWDARLSLVGSTRLITPEVLPNVWIGASITSQAEADRDIPKLLAVPAAKRFLSMEPLLGPVNLRGIPHGEGEIDALKPDTWEQAIEQWRDTDEDWVEQFEDWFNVSTIEGLTGPMHAAIDWVIVGGESGPGARPMHPDWARSLRDQCQAASVPYLFKQWGEWSPGHKEYGNELSFDLRTNSAGFEWYTGDVMTCKVLRVGKKAAGRMLDGRTWDEVPG